MLSTWIQPQHLCNEALERYRIEIRQSLGSTLVIDNWLQPERLQALQAVFSESGLFKPVYALINQGYRRVDESAWKRADPEERFYHHREIVGPRPGFELSRSYLSHIRFRDTLVSRPMLDYFAAIFGAPLGGMSAIKGKIFEPEHQLVPHSDAAPGRLLCAVLYLSPDWKPDYAGRFVLYRGEQVAGHVDPLCNRLLLFLPASDYLHAVEPRSPAAADFQRWNYSFWMTV